MSFILYCFSYFLSNNYNSIHPCYNTAQRMEMRWTFMMNTSSGEHCLWSIVCGVGVFHCCLTRESTYSSYKDNILCNKIYIIKSLIFCVYILIICITIWSWIFIRWDLRGRQRTDDGKCSWWWLEENRSSKRNGRLFFRSSSLCVRGCGVEWDSVWSVDCTWRAWACECSVVAAQGTCSFGTPWSIRPQQLNRPSSNRAGAKRSPVSASACERWGSMSPSDQALRV
jgi:hypothetical protein